MTPTESDGWSNQYSDPRDRPHPRVLRLTVETFGQLRETTINAAAAVAADDEPPAVVSFATVSELRKILTDRRIELLRRLTEIDGAAPSINALADNLGRGYRTVHDDVTLLEDYGVLYLVKEGKALRPFLPYDRIYLDVELLQAAPTDESIPA